MSVINVTVTNAGAANVAVSNGSTVNATVGNGGAVNVSTGTISPGNATVVSGTLTINSTTTLAAGSQAYVKNDAGTAYAAKLDIGIPAGPATLVSVGNTTTLAAGSNATVNGTTSGSNLTLTFGIPSGVNGTNGVTPSFAIGNVVTGAAGSSASVTATTANNGANVTLDLTIPRGDPGTNGTNGTGGSNLSLSDATPANLGTAAAGSSNLAARADHVHTLPSLSTLGAAAAGHGHNYVTSLNNLTGGLTLAAGGNVTLTSNGSTLTIAASGGGLGENDAVDGGNYVGEIIGGITFSVQPQSQTVNSTTNLTLSVPSSYLPALSGSYTYGPYPFGRQNAVPFTAGGVVYAAITAGSAVRRESLPGGGIPDAAIRFGAVWLTSSANNGATWSTPSMVKDTKGSDGIYAIIPYNTSLDTASQPVPLPLQATFAPSYASNGARELFSIGVRGMTAGAPAPVAFRTDTGVSNIAGYTALDYAFFDYLPSVDRFVAMKLDGEISSSSDGATWTFRLGGSQDGRGFARVGSAVLGLTESSLWRSTDGVQWTSQSPGFSAQMLASSGLVVLACASGNVYRTTNGTAWTLVTLPVPVSRVAYAAGLWWAFASATGTDVCTSPDGVTWTLRTLPASQHGSKPLYGAAGVGNTTILANVDGSLVTASSLTVAYADLTVSPATASFTLAATAASGNPVSYQWQSSLDAGTSWSNVANATSTALNLTGLTQSDSGTRYRAAASATGATTAFSQSATLTVTG